MACGLAWVWLSQLPTLHTNLQSTQALPPTRHQIVASPFSSVNSGHDLYYFPFGSILTVFSPSVIFLDHYCLPF